MNRIAIIGAGGLGRETLALIHQINNHQSRWDPIGFFDDRAPKGNVINRIPVLGRIDEVPTAAEDIWFIMAIGSPGTKETIAARMHSSIKFATLHHPLAVVADPETVTFGPGCIFTAGAKATADIRFGKHVLVNLNATVGHDTLVGDYCSIMPGANIAGYTNLGQSVLIGSGASVINQSTLGKGVKIGAGAVVINDIPDFATAVGVPARLVEK